MNDFMRFDDKRRLKPPSSIIKLAIGLIITGSPERRPGPLTPFAIIERFITLPRCSTQISYKTHPTIAEPRPRTQYPPRQDTKLCAAVLERSGSSHVRSLSSFL